MQMLIAGDVLGRLRTLREKKGLSQGHIARRLRIDRTTYVRKELGLIPITTEEWLKLAVAMDEDPCYFFRASAKRGHSPASQGAAGMTERALVELYRSLSREEKKDLISIIRLMLKGIRRKMVIKTLERLSAA
ncbi:MAG: helix-turn-helix transcriptional regulator [Deltaproteobacteria bacterium]|nr:helix-turn-helix transcriptional regulator [Deltaproteobacteria bacterium]